MISNFNKAVISEIISTHGDEKIWCLKVDVDYIKGTKNSEKNLRFQDYCIWIGNRKFSQSGTGYL